jgi:chromosome segregation ATPase
MYPHLDTALALSRSEQASLASINKELLNRNSSLRSRIRDLDDLLVSRDKSMDSDRRSAANTISTLQQSVMMMDQRLLKYQSRLSTLDEANAALEARLQATDRDKVQAQTDRQYLSQQLDTLKRAHHEDLLSQSNKHQLEMQRLQDDLTREISRIREQWLADQRAASQVLAEKLALQSRVTTLEADRASDRKTLVDTLAALETKRTELNDAQRELAQARAKVEALSLANAQQTTQISALNTRVTTLSKQVAAAQDETATWKRDAEQYHREKLDLQAQLAQHRDVVEQLREDLAQQREATRAAHTQRSQTAEHLEQEQGDRLRAEKRGAALAAELQSAGEAVDDLKRSLGDAQRALRQAGEAELALTGQVTELKLHHEATVESLQAARAHEIEALREKARLSEQALRELRFKLKNAQQELNVVIDHNESEGAAATALAKAHLRVMGTPRGDGGALPAAVSPYQYVPSSAALSAASSRLSAAALAAGSYHLRTPTTSGRATQVTATVAQDGPPVRIDVTPVKGKY